jgi:hypothetical protein
MDRRVYSAESLRRGLREFETHFGLSTEDFYERHRAGDELPVPRFERHVWASFYEDVLRLTADDSVMDRVTRSFAVPA